MVDSSEAMTWHCTNGNGMSQALLCVTSRNFAVVHSPPDGGSYRTPAASDKLEDANAEENTKLLSSNQR
jgi:hypothetical protein